MEPHCPEQKVQPFLSHFPLSPLWGASGPDRAAMSGSSTSPARSPWALPPPRRTAPDRAKTGIGVRASEPRAVLLAPLRHLPAQSPNWQKRKTQRENQTGVKKGNTERGTCLLGSNSALRRAPGLNSQKLAVVSHGFTVPVTQLTISPYQLLGTQQGF